MTSTEAKRAYALAAIKATKAGNHPVVVPEFTEDTPGNWVATDNVGLDSVSNPDSLWKAVQIVSMTTAIVNNFEQVDERWTLIRTKNPGNYVAGSKLAGKLYRKDSLIPSNPNDESQGLKYLTSALRLDGNYPCIHNGSPVYQENLYTLNLEQLDELLPTDNEAELLAKHRELKAATNGNNGNTQGTMNAKRIADLKSQVDTINTIPANKRNAQQKADLIRINTELSQLATA